MNSREQYQEYLQTPHWKELRQKVLDNPYYGRSKECFICKSGESLVVHHLTYQRKTKEREDDLIILCSTCHTDVHTIKGKFSLQGIYKKVFKMKLAVLNGGFAVQATRKKSVVLKKYEKNISNWKKKKFKKTPKNYPKKPKDLNSIENLGAIEFYRRKRLGTL